MKCETLKELTRWLEMGCCIKAIPGLFKFNKDGTIEGLEVNGKPCCSGSRVKLNEKKMEGI